MPLRFPIPAVALAALCLVTACSPKIEPVYPRTTGEGNRVEWDDQARDTVWGSGGGPFGLFAGDDLKAGGDVAGVGIPVNAYLWRAALDTVAFMPVLSADPFGGTILTDWHSPAGVEGERFKIDVRILSRELRADGVGVSVFREVMRQGQWMPAEVAQTTEVELENAILTRARQLRIAAN